MMTKPLVVMVALLAALALSGCGEDDSSGGSTQSAAESEAMPEDSNAAPGSEAEEATAPGQAGEMGTESSATAGKPGTKIVITDSEFGPIVKDAADQAIYIFENDQPGKSNCYGECAAAWPPVLTEGRPVAGAGADRALLGTTERADGTLQVTYADQPLYYYAHEAPGEVRCHNIDLNGGFWWVIGPDGKRRP